MPSLMDATTDSGMEVCYRVSVVERPWSPFVPGTSTRKHVAAKGRVSSHERLVIESHQEPGPEPAKWDFKLKYDGRNARRDPRAGMYGRP